MSDQKDAQGYKPFIPTDKDYLKNVANSIEQKAPIEDINFQLLNEAIAALGFSDDPYQFLTPDNLQAEEVQSLIEKTFNRIQEGISQSAKEKLHGLWDYLAQEDPLVKADLIFVFGGPGLNRVNEAVRLYKEGYGQKILFTGQKAAYMQDVNEPEGEYYARLAREQGIPEESLIVESEAKNTPENAVNSAAMLKAQNFRPDDIILITLPYHMRRSYLTFKAVADWSPRLMRHVAASAKYTRENYYQDKNGWSYIFNEFIKIYGGRLMKHF